MAITTGTKRKPGRPGPGRRFQPGNPGRPKGIPNKNTREIKEASRALLEDPLYLEALRIRLLRGEAGPVEPLLYHYAYGKPKDTLAIEGGPRPLVIDVVTEADVAESRADHDTD